MAAKVSRNVIPETSVGPLLDTLDLDKAPAVLDAGVVVARSDGKMPVWEYNLAVSRG